MARFLAILLLLFLATPSASAAERLVVYLDWSINPDHGPLIVARDRGFFAAQGLDVELRVPSDPNDPPKLVAAGEGDIAVTYQPQLPLQIAAGLPLVRFGTLIATPLNTVIVLRDGPIKTIADLRGKRIGYSVAGTEQVLLARVLAGAGLTLDDVDLVNVNFSLLPALLSHQVDAIIGGYRNFELNKMAIDGHPGRAFFLEDEGVPAYEELIYVTRRDKLAAPELRGFLLALEQATYWILNHPAEAWDVFKASDDGLDDELNRRAWQDTWPRFAQSPAALAFGKYQRFAAFLEAQHSVINLPPLSSYAVDLFATAP
ncbi:ABC transporter substrate-binding protein [Inquilinus sp. CA228]|uniref:ABC transporter substrate-binding protein n=1 Tax=Inquilinus sp. CA228 TaxID=3455609 RepID=UPI003F8CF364